MEVEVEVVEALQALEHVGRRRRRRGRWMEAEAEECLCLLVEGGKEAMTESLTVKRRVACRSGQWESVGVVGVVSVRVVAVRVKGGPGGVAGFKTSTCQRQALASCRT